MQSYVATGTLIKDPVTNNTQSGYKVTNVSIWVKKKEMANTKKTFVPCEAWADVSAHISRGGFQAGDMVFISGNLKSQSWTDEHTGQQRTRLSVVLAEIHKINAGNPVPAEEGPQQPAQTQAPPQTQQPVQQQPTQTQQAPVQQQPTQTQQQPGAGASVEDAPF